MKYKLITGKRSWHRAQLYVFLIGVLNLKFLVVLVEGLANRMQCVDSAIGFARALNSEIEILWWTNDALNCTFERLFEVPDAVKVTHVDNWRDHKNHVEAFGATHVLDRDFFEASKPNALFWNAPGFDVSDRLLFRISKRFYAPKYGDTNLRLNLNIIGKVEEQRQLVEKCLGVHVRRTDHNWSIQSSQTADFFALLDARPAEENFFLSTDDENELVAFKDRYGDRLFHYRNRSLDRSQSEAIEDALINLMLLSHCTSIIGSVGSTFSGCAAFMGNKLLHRITR